MESANKGNILIADDNPDNLTVLSELLKSEGYSVRMATDGIQALKSIEKLEPDLLLLDVHMPKMDGFTLCSKLKQELNYQNLPIIFVSALNDSFNKTQGFKAGAIDFITKPYDEAEVKVRIHTHLQLRELLIEVEALRNELKRLKSS